MGQQEQRARRRLGSSRIVKPYSAGLIVDLISSVMISREPSHLDRQL